MSDERYSWSGLGESQNLIGRKKVDWSIFMNGTHVPIDFHGAFKLANGGVHLNRGEKREITLIINGVSYSAMLVNIDRKGVFIDTLQVRYESNGELRQLIKQEFQNSFAYIQAEREKKALIGDKSYTVVPDNKAEYIEFYKTNVPFQYLLKLIKNTEQNRNIWWVNQGTTLSSERDEGILWAPLKSKNGQKLYHWETMSEVKKGDIILHYANGALRYVSEVTTPAIEAPKPASLGNNSWQDIGRLVRTEYFTLKPVIGLNDFSKDLLKLDIPQGPIDVNGNVKQGYLFRFSSDAFNIIMQAKSEVVWPNFALVNNLPDEGKSSVGLHKEEVNAINPSELINTIYNYISKRGFIYESGLIKNFYLCLKTKPFVILAGISGTGKSKLVELFAEAVGATSENGQYTLIPVRPDWNDSSDLLGYKDINGQFQAGPLTRVIEKASNNLDKPYFVCLDEMNLSRVEYYFSDFLSLMETKKKPKNEAYSERLFHDDFFVIKEDLDKFGPLRIPPNLYVIGTVNMDETTFPFSKKVLDRANTIEFSEVDFTLLPAKESYPVETLISKNQSFETEYIYLKDCLEDVEYVRIINDKLDRINKVLTNANLQVGYRVRDEICFYMIYNKSFKLLDEDDALDYAIKQKILPRIQGSSNQIFKVLIELFQIATGQNYANEDGNVADLALKYVQDNSEVKPYPRSARKMATMLGRFEDGFTSFWL